MNKLSGAVGFAILLAGSPVAAQPLPPAVTTQVPGVYRFLVGDVRVTALSDGSVPIDLHQLLRGATPAEIDALLARSFLVNPTEASINVFLLELGRKRVLVDVGAGDIFGPGNGGKLPEALAAAGVRPEEISDILVTHVHSDHSGGLVVGGRMMFPNATVHVGKPDVEFFLDKANAARTGYDERYFDEAAKTLKPYADAGRVRSFDRRSELLPGIVAELQPGHTPGSAFYTLTSRGQRLAFIGDTIHVAAVQFPAPNVTITFDQDQPRARAIRQRAFSRLAADGTLIAAPHLSFPGVGRIRGEATGYGWVPVEYGNRSAGTEAPKLEARPTPPRSVRPAGR